MEDLREKKNKLPFYIWITYFMELYIGFNYAATQFTLLEVKTEFNISSTLMATISSVQLVTGLLMTFVFSKILDHIDIKKTLITGLSISVAGSLIAAMSNGPVMTAGSNLISSIGSSITMATPYPILMLTDPQRVTLHVNRQQGLLSLGSVISPLVMAFLMNILGLSWRVGYFMGAFILLVLLIVVIRTKSPGRSDSLQREEETEEEKKHRKRIVLTPAFICMGLILAFYMFMESGVLNYSKDYFAVGLNDMLGASLCISAIRGGMTITRLLGDKLSKNRVLVTAVSLFGCTVCVLLLGLVPLPVVSLVWCFLFGLLAGPAWPVAMSMGLSLDEKASGKMSSILMLYNNVGNTLGNICNGFFVDHIGVNNGFLIDTLYGALALLALFIGVKSFRKLGISAEGEEYLENIRKKNENSLFTRRGSKYPQEEVDAYIAAVREKVAVLDAELEELRAENAKHMFREDQMVSVLVTTQDRSREMMDKAGREASEIMEKATSEKQSIVDEMNEKGALLSAEYASKKNEFDTTIGTLESMKSQFGKAIEEDLMGFLTGMQTMDSVRFLENLSDEQKEKMRLIEKKIGNN